MRKIALLTMPLLVLGLFSLSAEMMVDPTGVSAKVSGDATLTWGIDLGTNATGFTNAMSSNLEVTIIPEGSTDTGMMDTNDLYAYIKLKDFKWVANKDGGATTAPGVEAKLIMGAFSITTFSAPTIHVDFVDDKDDDKADDGSSYPGFGYPDFAPDVETTYKGSGGLTLGYKIDPVEFSVGVISANDWTPDKAEAKEKLDCHLHGDDPATAKVVEGPEHVYVPKDGCKKDVNDDGGTGNKDGLNDENAYAFLGTVKLAIGDNATLDAAVAYGHEYDSKPIGIGAKAEFKLSDDDIVPHVAFDGKIPEDDSGIPWDVGGGIKWNISDDDESSISTELIMHAPADGDSTLAVAATLTEGDGDTGGLEGLGATLHVRLDGLTGDTSTWTTNVAASYLVEGIKPFFDIAFSNATGAKTAFKAGLELSMIDHLTTTIQYASKDISGDTPDRGTVTAAVKIAY